MAGGVLHRDPRADAGVGRLDRIGIGIDDAEAVVGRLLFFLLHRRRAGIEARREAEDFQVDERVGGRGQVVLGVSRVLAVRGDDPQVVDLGHLQGEGLAALLVELQYSQAIDRAGLGEVGKELIAGNLLLTLVRLGGDAEPGPDAERSGGQDEDGGFGVFAFHDQMAVAGFRCRSNC